MTKSVFFKRLALLMLIWSNSYAQTGVSGDGIIFSDGTMQSTAASIAIALSSDQTVGAGGIMLGLGNQSNQLDDVALPSPIKGKVTSLTFSIEQNIGAGNTPANPTSRQSVAIYIVIVPYDNDITYPDTYGTPAVTTTSLESFLADWETSNGALTACTEVAEATSNTYVPTGTKITLKTVLDSTNKHVAVCNSGALTINQKDLFSVWIKPSSFTSFIPAAVVSISPQ